LLFVYFSIYPAEPAGAILSTGEDMAKYLRFHLKDGTTEDGKTLLNPILLFEAYTGKKSFDIFVINNTRFSGLCG
jgi:CubicO group peptidase (beta-lactamase class C family)